MNCELCGALLPANAEAYEAPTESGINKICQDLYYSLAFYTLNLKDKAFLNQYIVDAYAAQHATKETKPIKITFALVGLYLMAEKGYTGRQVQQAHMQLAR